MTSHLRSSTAEPNCLVSSFLRFLLQSLEVVEYVDEDGMLSPSKGPRDVSWLWRSAKERAAWQVGASMPYAGMPMSSCSKQQ